MQLTTFDVVRTVPYVVFYAMISMPNFVHKSLIQLATKISPALQIYLSFKFRKNTFADKKNNKIQLISSAQNSLKTMPTLP